jgi:hypothetical protein
MLRGRKWLPGTGRVLFAMYAADDFRIVGKVDGRKVQFDSKLETRVRRLELAP